MAEHSDPPKTGDPSLQAPEEHPATTEAQHNPGLRDSTGWDGKLRMPKNALLANPEALSDPEYSDDDHVVPGEEISADEDLLETEPLDSEELVLTHCRIQSIPALRLERFKTVTKLCLRQNSIQDIDGLTSLAETLHELDLYDNLISHVRGLDDLSRLKVLDLSFNKIKHIKHINHLRNLTDLFFVSNKISAIENLGGLDSLRMLELGSNRIREIKNLESLQNIEELWLAKNKITELKGLSGLLKLRLLSIQSNRIRDLSPLREAPTLEELYISHNALETVEGLEQNTRLRVLEVSNNQIARVHGLQPLTQLEEFWASYNQISDFTEVESELKDKTNLTTVYFEGNPLQTRSPALYRNKVKLALPQVQQIDATFVRAT